MEIKIRDYEWRTKKLNLKTKNEITLLHNYNPFAEAELKGRTEALKEQLEFLNDLWNRFDLTSFCKRDNNKLKNYLSGKIAEIEGELEGLSCKTRSKMK